jgi:GH25 family lysozyme M1 (1,4-beta-N-acetylmuramidase)
MEDNESDIEEDAGTEETEDVDEETDDTEDAADTEDPETAAASATGASVSVEQLLSATTVSENQNPTLGIDVAKYQGTIDWSAVAASGIDFAMIRVGYRTMESGEICADTNARYNMQEACANGIQIGAYFFSTAINEQEAIEEADWVADYISKYAVTYPVAYNCEGFNTAGNRQYGLSTSERSKIASAFLGRIYERGYTPMFYAAKSELANNALWDTSSLELSYKMWVAYYGTNGTESIGYDGACAMWQYTNRGTVDGISKPVDIDIAYFGYDGTAAAKSDEAPETASADVEALMNFTSVNETVTAKSTTNLRNIPSQGSDSTVMATLTNGDTATRTGTSSSGWSRVEYQGNVYYAVSSYLTTDLNAPAQTTSTAAEGSDSGDGLKTQFTACQDSVTAKIEVNLRTLPSVTNPDATVAAVLHNGEVVTRTGINNDYGWSRVDYNGQTLYCITSYLTAAE